MRALLQLCEWFGAMPSSVALRESVWVYPIVESIHVLGLCVFLGLAVLLDLRLVGVALRTTPVSEITGRLLPWMVLGFAVMVITGTLLFFSDPVRFYGNIFFRVKVVMLAVAGLNAFVFHSTVFRRIAVWDAAPVVPVGARVAGAMSLVLWTGIVTTGRMIAYNWFQ